MNDFDIMQKCRLKWVRELGQNTNQPCPTDQALAGYHRGFLDALEVALDKVIADERAYVSSGATDEGLEIAARLCDAYAADTEQMKNESRGYWTEEAKAVFNTQKELARHIRSLKVKPACEGGG